MTTQRLVRSCAVAGLVLLVGALLRERSAEAQSVPTVLRARTIELVDAHGNVRAQLGVERDGEVVFRLRDARGRIRVKLGASESGSGMLLANESTEPGVHILAKRDDTFVTVQRGERRQVVRP